MGAAHRQPRGAGTRTLAGAVRKRLGGRERPLPGQPRRSCRRLASREPVSMLRQIVCSALVAGCGVSASQAAPYANPALLQVPWGHYSFVRQAWRGYVETLPASTYRDGLGVVWGQPAPGKSEMD